MVLVLRTLVLPAFKKMIVGGLFLDRESAEKDSPEFVKQSVSFTRSVSESTSTFGWLTSATNSRLDQVKVGRNYCRLNLTSTAMGLALHPMSQLLEGYDEMLDLQQQFKQHFNIAEQDTLLIR